MRARQATTSVFFFYFKYYFQLCSNFHYSRPSPQALNPEFFFVFSNCSKSLKQFLISDSAQFLSFIWTSKASSVIQASLINSCTSGLLKKSSSQLLSTLQKHSSNFLLSSVSSCLDSRIIMAIKFCSQQGKQNCMDRFSPKNLANFRIFVQISISKSMRNLLMFIIVKQQELLREQSIKRPLQFYDHYAVLVSRKSRTRVKKIGFRGFNFTRMVSQSSLSSFIIDMNAIQILQQIVYGQQGQQIQMFDYNPQQKSIQGIYRLPNLQPGPQNWKLAYLQSPEGLKSPQFIKRINFDSVKTNPFAQIEQLQRSELINDLDFSTIELKSPTYSELYNSIGQDRFFHALPKEKNREDLSPKAELNAFNGNREKELREAIERERNLHEVPTFFIKMPEHFRNERQQQRKYFKNKMKEELNSQLEDIYKGKYKISRSQQ